MKWWLHCFVTLFLIHLNYIRNILPNFSLVLTENTVNLKKSAVKERSEILDELLSKISENHLSWNWYPEIFFLLEISEILLEEK